MNYLDIGVDIGGTNTVFGLVDPSGDIVQKGSFPTMETGDFRSYVNRLATNLNSLIANTNARIRGVGVGAPCGNSLTGELEAPVHLGWGRVNLSRALRPLIGDLPVRVTNDANAAALGEKAYGVARDMDDFIELTLGTGVGSGIFTGGRLVTGRRGLAGELGHIRYRACGERRCGCGRSGCLDAWCSARGVSATAREIFDEIGKNAPADLTSFDVYLAASNGDPGALKVFEITGMVLGNAIADMVTFSDPEAVILFGGLAHSGPILLEPTRRAFAENVLPMFADTKILLSSVAEGDAALLGAAALNNTELIETQL